jgi:hypothetical protein
MAHVRHYTRNLPGHLNPPSIDFVSFLYRLLTINRRFFCALDLRDSGGWGRAEPRRIKLFRAHVIVARKVASITHS